MNKPKRSNEKYWGASTTSFDLLLYERDLDEYICSLEERKKIPLDADVREWVAVEDKLPETYSDVLILTNYGKMATAYVSNPKQPTYGWTDTMRPEHGYGSVTHWMELPSKPSA